MGRYFVIVFPKAAAIVTIVIHSKRLKTQTLVHFPSLLIIEMIFEVSENCIKVVETFPFSVFCCIIEKSLVIEFKLN